MDGVFMSLLRGGSRVSIGAATVRKQRARASLPTRAASSGVSCNHQRHDAPFGGELHRQRERIARRASCNQHPAAARSPPSWTVGFD